MNRARLAVAAAVLLAACSDNSNTPMSPVEGGPQLAITVTFNAANAPSGAHVQTGTPDVTLNGLTATSSQYELAGVGNLNATANLALTFSATVDCTNHGGKLVPVKSSVQGAVITSGSLSPENGRLTVPSLTNGGSSPTAQQFLAAAVCPNGNWTKSLAGGSIQFSGFVYTLTFAGFSGPFILITGP